MRVILAILLMLACPVLAEDVRFIVVHKTGLESYRVEVWPFATPDCPRCTRFQVVKVFPDIVDPGYVTYGLVRENLTASQATALVDALEAGVIADEYAAK